MKPRTLFHNGLSCTEIHNAFLVIDSSLSTNKPECCLRDDSDPLGESMVCQLVAFAQPRQAKRAKLSSQVQQLYSRLQLAADLQGSILKACNPKAANRRWPAIADLKAGVEGQPA